MTGPELKAAAGSYANMTPEEFARKMREIANECETEKGHEESDIIMCQILETLGYGEGVGVFREMKKWYA